MTRSIGARRILLYGVTGSGKSTLAERLSWVTGLPWQSVDDLTWEPGWLPVPDEEQRRKIAAICAGDEWILDSGYSKWLDIPLARVELIIGLDYPRWLSLRRLLRRTVVRAVNRQPVCNGNRESLRLAIGRESLIRWHFASFGRKRRRMQQWAAQPPRDGIRVMLLRHPRQTRRWTDSLTGRSNL